MRRSGLGLVFLVFGSGLAGAAPLVAPINCTIKPSQVVELAAPMVGIIEEVAVKPGDKVRKGQLIARFVADLAEVELQAAKARTATTGLDLARVREASLLAKLNRMEAAFAAKALPAAEIEAARLDYAIAQADVQRESEALTEARLEVDRMTIVVDRTSVISPVDGTIGEGLIDPGESPQNAPIATIVVTDPLRVEAYVPIVDAQAFIAAPGHYIMVAGTKMPVDIDYASDVADLASGTVSVFFNLHATETLAGFDCTISASEGANP